jgi:zinc protease
VGAGAPAAQTDPTRYDRSQSPDLPRTPAGYLDPIRPPDDPAPIQEPRVPTIEIPTVSFSDERLANGLRLIVAEDHVAPVVAVNVWYAVGSKHEQPGKTGFAHLFEHVMFQGSKHVAKAEHIALVQAAGGTMNGTTWLDRTNYFETMPSHQLDLALWLEADRMATLLEALNQENLDNQREVVKNEKRWSYDNRPYGTWQEKLQAHLYPPEHPYHHSTIGSMEDLDAASLEDVSAFFRTYYAPNNAVLSIVGDVDTDEVRRSVERYFGAIAPNPSIPPLGDLSLPPTLGGEIREIVHDRVPLPRIYIGFRAPVYGDRRLDALEVAGQILAGGKGSRLHRRLVREERIAQDVALFTLGFIGGASIQAGWATVRPGVAVDRVEAALHEETERLVVEPVSADELARAFALIEADELGALQRVEERADRLSMYATHFDDPGLVNEMLARYLSVTPEAILEVAAATFRPDNRLVLTYLPELPPADSEAVSPDATDEAETETETEQDEEEAA